MPAFAPSTNASSKDALQEANRSLTAEISFSSESAHLKNQPTPFHSNIRPVQSTSDPTVPGGSNTSDGAPAPRIPPRPTPMLIPRPRTPHETFAPHDNSGESASRLADKHQRETKSSSIPISSLRVEEMSVTNQLQQTMKYLSPVRRSIASELAKECDEVGYRA